MTLYRLEIEVESDLSQHEMLDAWSEAIDVWAEWYEPASVSLSMHIGRTADEPETPIVLPDFTDWKKKHDAALDEIDRAKRIVAERHGRVDNRCVDCRWAVFVASDPGVVPSPCPHIEETT